MRKLFFCVFLALPLMISNGCYYSEIHIMKREHTDYLLFRNTFHINTTFTDTQIDTVVSISDRLHIPKHISFNLIFKESCFDSTAISSVGCYGYLQLHPRYFTATTSYDNILQGLQFLKKQYDRFKNWEQAIIYYNSGESMFKNTNFVNYILTNGNSK